MGRALAKLNLNSRKIKQNIDYIKKPIYDMTGMVTRKEETPQRVVRRKQEEKNKEKRKEKYANFQTMIPRDLKKSITF